MSIIRDPVGGETMLCADCQKKGWTTALSGGKVVGVPPKKKS